MVRSKTSTNILCRNQQLRNSKKNQCLVLVLYKYLRWVVHIMEFKGITSIHCYILRTNYHAIYPPQSSGEHVLLRVNYPKSSVTYPQHRTVVKSQHIHVQIEIGLYFTTHSAMITHLNFQCLGTFPHKNKLINFRARIS